MARLRLASPFLFLALATAPAAAQSSLGSPQQQVPQPVPRGTAPAPAPDQVLRLPPGTAQRPQRAPAAEGRASPDSPGRTAAPSQRLTAPPGAVRVAPPAAPAAPAAAGRTPPTQSAPQTPVKRPRAAAGATAAGATAGAAAAAAAAGQAAPPPASPAPTPTELQQPSVGSVTGLPVPRFVSLRSDEVNLRIGPDTRYPIEWTYQRRDLPVEILREYNQWRRIRDMEGTEGWVHQSTLAGRRTFLARGEGPHELHGSESEASPVVARLMPGVVGRLRSCRADGAWCEVQVGSHRGYLKRSEIWGIAPGEDVN